MDHPGMYFGHSLRATVLTRTLVKEIAGIVTALTTGSPEEQATALNTYYLPDASFTHPFCRVPSFPTRALPIVGDVDSRLLILAIYKWYKTLSPKIEITVDSAVFDQRTGLLYVSARQTFALWFVPFYKAPVSLMCRLHLRQRTSWVSQETVSRNHLTEGRESNALSGPGQERSKYYIARQEDFYSIPDVIRFLMPVPGPFLWSGWQLFCTFLCAGLLIFLWPLYRILNKESRQKKQ
ncbi:hypothetical protein S40293_04451 [Stachybotrys chartarum IBT 40293]|nr:hypothetical protein S40293_04451 [Stachybotrys chartarum IBT 40293]